MRNAKRRLSTKSPHKLEVLKRPNENGEKTISIQAQVMDNARIPFQVKDIPLLEDLICTLHKWHSII
jgi:hypothetical protein